MAVLLLFVFAISSGVATFIENDYGTDAAWSIVYTSWWFALIQVALALILINNIIKFKMYKKDKFPAFLFHLGFIVILIGAGITRYYGFEGILHIRNGNSENHMISSDSYVTASAIKDGKKYTIHYKKLLSSIGNDSFDLKLNVKGDIADIKFKDYILNAVTKLVSDPNGKPAITMLISVGGSPETVTLKQGQVHFAGDNVIVFDAKTFPTSKNIVNIKVKNGKFYIKSAKPISWFRMVANKKGSFDANKEYEFTTGRLYTIGGVNIAPRQMLAKAKEKIASETNPLFKGRKGMKLSAVVVDVSYKGKTKEVAMFGRGKGAKGLTKKVTIAGTPFEFEWGSKIIKLPFSIKLLEFQLDRYPGSMSPMSYASEVEVIDKNKNINMPYRIYMNHVLSYGGYRFFQSSYDQDELGTILSVNKDPGKWPTYLGYFLLGLGLLLNILNPKSRFRKLAYMIQRDTNKIKSVLIAMFLAISFLHVGVLQADTLSYLKKFDKTHAAHFGTILVESYDGRIMPIDSLADEILNKIHRSTPKEWQSQKIIKVYDPKLKKIIGMDKNDKYASFNQFFSKDVKGNGYKLTKYAEVASREKPSDRNKFDKDVIKVDERLNVSYMVYTGSMLKMIPKVNDPSHKWYGPEEAIKNFPASEVKDIRKLLASYFDGIAKGLKNGDWSSADTAVDNIKKYQEQYASSIIPSPSKINAEITFNKARVFQRLVPIYLLSGLFLLILVFSKMINPKLNIKKITKFMFWVIVLAFIAHTVGLALRGYIDGHAPWSSGYESMIYIAWTIILAGIIFSRQAVIALSLTSILAGVTLFVAHLSWMDPKITTLEL